MFGSRTPRHSVITVTAATLVFSTLGLTFGAASPVFADDTATTTSAPETPAVNTPTEAPTPEPATEAPKADEPKAEPKASETSTPEAPDPEPATKQRSIAAASITPTVDLTVAHSSIELGTYITGSANVLPSSATGSFVFSVYGPDDPTCSTTALWGGVRSAPAAVSAPVTPTAVGTYRMVVRYTGDTTYSSVTSACDNPAATFTVTPTKAIPTISAAASPDIALASGSISGSTTLTGGSNPTGTITSKLYTNTGCFGTPLFTSTTPVQAGVGTYSSESFTPTSKGTYQWVSSYSGDDGNKAVSSPCNNPNASVVVGTPAPVLTQDPSPGGLVGTTLSDSATLTKVTSGANGYVSFSLFGPDDATCSRPAVFVINKQVSGPGTYSSGPFTPTKAGAYHWNIRYLNDAINPAVFGPCNDPAATLDITKAAVTLTATAPATGTVGTPMSDDVTVSSPIPLTTGTIYFELFGPNDEDCSGPSVFRTFGTFFNTSTTQSKDFTPTLPGTYHWVALYEGNDSHLPITNPRCDDGQKVVVSLLVPAITSQASAGGTVGTSVTDTATLSGVTTGATGNVTFSLYGPNDATCSDPAWYSSTKAVSGAGSYTSDSYTTTVGGTFRWIASYSGDANNAALAGSCNAPTSNVVIDKAPVTLTTSAEGGELVTFGMRDTATVSSTVPFQFGTVVFNLYGPGDATCTGTPIFTDSQFFFFGTGNGIQSALFYPAQTGTYHWVASFSGDAAHLPATGTCGDPGETTVVSPPKHPTLSSQVSTPTLSLAGGSVTDTATLVGGDAHSFGDMAFAVYGPDDATCAGAPVFTSTTQSSDGAATSAAFTPTEVGTYRWVASFAGDFRNDPATGACNDANESVTVTRTTTMLTTTATTGPVDLGKQIQDTGSIAGGNTPTGTLTFDLYASDDTNCTGTPVFTSTVAVFGNGRYASAQFTPTAVGTYRFVASYSGDANNAAAAGACGDAGESVTVTDSRLDTTLTTHVSDPTVLLGDTVSDIAEIGPAGNPGGAVTFDLYGPGDDSCTGTPVFTTSVPAESTTVESYNWIPEAIGTYRFIASYSGDDTYKPVAGSCGDAGESFTVVKPTASMSVQSSNSDIDLGDDFYSLSVLDHTGTATPTGTTTINVFGPDDATCTGAPAFTDIQTTDNEQNAGPFSPAEAGVYRIVATYSGDATFDPVSSPCSDEFNSVTVTEPVATISTYVSNVEITLGGGIQDTADLTYTGSHEPTGTITFRAYGPDDETCSTTPVFTDVQTVNPVDGTTSAYFSPTDFGDYRLIADYSGDDYYAAVSGACNDPGEFFRVYRQPTSISGQVSDSQIHVGGSFHDTVTIDPQGPVAERFAPSGSVSAAAAVPAPTGTVTFTFYGPGDTTCSTPIASSSAPAAARVDSADFAPPAPGTYRVIAEYSGDANYSPATTDCSDEGQDITVTALPTVPHEPGGVTTPPASHGTTGNPAATLPETGAPGNAGLIALLGLVLIGCGAVLIGANRRRG